MLNYKYYDTPEGQDIFKKVFVTSKYAAAAGISYGTLDILMYSHTKGVINTGARYMFFIGPLVGMATAFTVTTNVAQNVRGKNDMVNYFLGGVAAGSVFSAWSRSIFVGVPAAMVLGVAAMVKKISVDEGWSFFPKVPNAAKNAWDANRDYTIRKDFPEYKNWTNGTK